MVLKRNQRKNRNPSTKCPPPPPKKKKERKKERKKEYTVSKNGCQKIPKPPILNLEYANSKPMLILSIQKKMKHVTGKPELGSPNTVKWLPTIICTTSGALLALGGRSSHEALLLALGVLLAFEHPS